jgi:hypothetical protein
MQVSNRIVSALFVAVLILGGGFAPGLANDPGLFTGDANCDFKVDSRDAALVLQVDAQLVDELPFPQAADANKDGRINSLDAALILQFSAGFIPDRQPDHCVLTTSMGAGASQLAM